ncbi:unnamed protein product [Pleuronectes platessa]|uniref:Uncharacterized protein n=1 Tax=Pleuronectes platessa TaxID=8262 RepID=A0A9N7VCP8_PLEPL|nr:unnamed protein product [Pleuronectes platessa]
MEAVCRATAAAAVVVLAVDDGPRPRPRPRPSTFDLRPPACQECCRPCYPDNQKAHSGATKPFFVLSTVACARPENHLHSPPVQEESNTALAVCEPDTGNGWRQRRRRRRRKEGRVVGVMVQINLPYGLFSFLRARYILNIPGGRARKPCRSPSRRKRIIAPEDETR